MMYCYKCGAQIPDDSVFCSKCGTKIITEVQGTGVSNKINNDKNHIDHKALSIYLNDLLGLEFILHKYKVAFSERKKELDGYNSHNMKNTYYKNYFPTGDDDWIKYYGYDDFSDFADYEYNYRTCLHFAYTGTDNKYYLLMEEFYGVWYPWGRYFTRSYDQWKEIDETLKDPKAWDYCNIQARQINNAGALGWFKKKEALMRAVRCFEKYFATFQSECKQGLITNQEKISKLELEFEELKEEKEKFESLLQKTYALNIIPKQFRNIYD